MQVIPLALGQVENTIVLWDEQPELGVALPRPVQVVDEVRFGTGTLGDEWCLILYLFIGEQTIEVFLPEHLPTSPEAEVEVWHVLCRFDPDSFRVRYGASAGDARKEVLLLCPKAPGERLSDKLEEFYIQSKGLADAEDEVLANVFGRLEEALAELPTRGN